MQAFTPLCSRLWIPAASGSSLDLAAQGTVTRICSPVSENEPFIPRLLPSVVSEQEKRDQNKDLHSGASEDSRT